MANPYNRGALTRRKERLAARGPLMDTEMAPAHREPIGETQVERQALSPQAESSAVKKIDPAMVADLLSSTPTVQSPRHAEGKQVFTDQNQVAELYAEADARSLTSFKSEFKSARAKGEKEFSYKGDRFNTRKKGETADDWISALTPFEPGFTRERNMADIPAAKEVGN